MLVLVCFMVSLTWFVGWLHPLSKKKNTVVCCGINLAFKNAEAALVFLPQKRVSFQSLLAPAFSVLESRTMAVWACANAGVFRFCVCLIVPLNLVLFLPLRLLAFPH